MDFDFTSEQAQLKDSIERYIAAQYGSLENRERLRRHPGGYDRNIWKKYAELGFLGMSFAEEEGGFGGGPVETMIVMEAIGRALALEPFLSTGVLASTALRFGASAEQKKRLIPQIVEGTLLLSLAWQEPQARYELANIATTAQRDGDRYLLNGRKDLILNGDTAGMFIVSARTSGSQRDESGVALFLVFADAPGVRVSGYDSQDGGRLADVILTDAIAEPLGPIDRGLPLLERAIEAGIAAVAAQAVGSMEALQALTVDYLKTRKQFGVAIGSFQALQHKAVDMLLMVEQARSMACYAAMMVDAKDANERRTVLSAVKVQINASARFVGQTAVQLHGGIGMTMEYIGAHHFKRLCVIETQFGDTAFHLARVAGAGGLAAA